MRFAAVAFLAAVVPSAAFVTPFSGTVLLGMRDVGRPVLRSQRRTARPMAGPVMQVSYLSVCVNYIVVRHRRLQTARCEQKEIYAC